MPIISYPSTSDQTLENLVEGVLSTLYGQTSQQDSFTSLEADISSTDLTFTVDDASSLSVGLIEVDMEIMRIAKVDVATNLVTLHPRGRGRRATVAAAHTAGAEVRMQPIIPYSSVVREIRAELSNLYPSICQVSSVEFTSNATHVAYELPADARMVLDVRYKDTQGEWERVRVWEVEFSQNTTDFPTGVALRLQVPTQSTIRVIYGKPFGVLNELTDTLSAAGIPQSCEDILRIGAVIRLLPSLDIARLSATTASGADAAARQPQPGTGIMVARELRAQHKDRVESEVSVFRQTYPARIHITR